MLIGVNPGNRVDLVEIEIAVATIEKEVGPRHPRKDRAPETPGLPSPRTVSPQLTRSDGCGNDGPTPLLQVLVPVIVELASRDDFSHNRRLRLIVAQHGNLELPRVDPLFDEQAGSRISRRPWTAASRSLQVLELGDPHGRTGPRGFHEDRQRGTFEAISSLVSPEERVPDRNG